MPYEEKALLFLAAMRDSVLFHKKNCVFYATFLSANAFDGRVDNLADIPPLPIGIFKKRTLLSVPQSDIVKMTHSSATTSGTPSSISIDRVTRERQRTALSKIMSSLLGGERRPFVIFDSRSVVESTAEELSSRATTIRGLLAFSSGFFCLLDSELQLRASVLQEALKKMDGRSPVFFGVTTILYEIFQKYKHDRDVRALLKEFPHPTVLFSGGWKKLASMNIDHESFKKGLAEFFSVARNDLIDFYGMIEQPGVIYPECAYGYKHVPAYAEVIIRDLRSMRPLGASQEGMIEVLSPLAHSYPGIALLTDDIGSLGGNDGCTCGRRGQFFSFVRRAPEAETKGCADALELPP